MDVDIIWETNKFPIENSLWETSPQVQITLQREPSLLILSTFRPTYITIDVKKKAPVFVGVSQSISVFSVRP